MNFVHLSATFWSDVRFWNYGSLAFTPQYKQCHQSTANRLAAEDGQGARTFTRNVSTPLVTPQLPLQILPPYRLSLVFFFFIISLRFFLIYINPSDLFLEFQNPCSVFSTFSYQVISIKLYTIFLSLLILLPLFWPLFYLLMVKVGSDLWLFSFSHPQIQKKIDKVHFLFFNII